MVVRLEDKWIGERLIEAGVLTVDKRDKVLEIQTDPIHKHIRFGDIAIGEGFCTEDQIEAIGGFLGELLIEQGVLTTEQCQKILTLQKRMRHNGLYTPNFGEMCAIHEFCQKEDIERAIRMVQIEKRREQAKGSAENESSEW